MSPLLANRLLIPLPPIWLLGVAAALTIVCGLAGYGLLAIVRPRDAAEARASLRDGFLGPLAWLLAAFAALAVAITPALWSTSPSPLDQIGRSLVRLASADRSGASVPIDPRTVVRVTLPRLRPQEIQALEFQADGPLVVRTPQPAAGLLVTEPEIALEQGRPWTWQKTFGTPNPFLGQRAFLEVRNGSGKPVRLTLLWNLAPEQPEVAILPVTFAVLAAIVLLYALFRLTCRRTAAVAAATTKEAIGQPMFPLAVFVGCFFLLLFIVLPYNTFGEDVKMFKDSGLTLVKVLALLVVVWTASVAVADEVEGRTALTVLSKPLRRWQFLLGKFAGLTLVALLVFLILGGVLLAATNFKVVYDARESSQTDPLWQACAAEMTTLVPGLALAFMETIVLASISLAVSTRLGMVPNLVVCFTVYTLGHLVPLIVQSSAGRNEIVRFVGRLLATILPVLEHFTVEAAVMRSVAVPWGYLAWAACYAGLYVAVALLVAYVLFQDRDLA
jgi:ABC-type transport system involved in multi-copper enzyme maturation permease subunit